MEYVPVPLGMPLVMNIKRMKPATMMRLVTMKNKEERLVERRRGC
jgi:hypothetical protein